MHQFKLDAVRAYSKINKLDKIIYSGGNKPRYGIISTGKSFMDTLQSLEMLGINESKANERDGFARQVWNEWKQVADFDIGGIGTFM